MKSYLTRALALPTLLATFAVAECLFGQQENDPAGLLDGCQCWYTFPPLINDQVLLDNMGNHTAMARRAPEVITGTGIGNGNAASLHTATRGDFITGRWPVEWSGTWTLSFWVNHTANQGYFCGAWSLGSGRRSWTFGGTGDGSLRRFYYSANGTDTSSYVSLENRAVGTGWHHYVLAHEADGTLHVFYDGTEESSSPHFGVTIGPAQSPLTIGSNMNFYDFGPAGVVDCQIAEFAIWDRILSATEVAMLFDSGNGLTCPQAIPEIPDRVVLILGGQSNSSGFGDNLQPYTGTTGSDLYGHDYVRKPLADPVASAVNKVDIMGGNGGQGSFWPIVASQLSANGRQFTLVPAAVGGREIADFQKPNFGLGSYRKEEYGFLLSRIVSSYQFGKHRFLLWYQGESDVSAGTTTADYKAGIVQLAEDIFADTGVPMIAAKIHRLNSTYPNFSPAAQDAIAEGMRQAWFESNHIIGAVDASGIDITALSNDGLHITSDANLAAVANAFVPVLEYEIGRAVAPPATPINRAARWTADEVVLKADDHDDFDFSASGTDAFSVSLWFFQAAADNAGLQALISQYEFTERSWFIGLIGGKLRLWWDGPGGAKVYSSPVAHNDAWHHCLVTWRNNALKCYVDGVEISMDKFTDDTIASVFDSNASVMLGRINAGGDYWYDFVGSLSHAAIWGRELTAAEAAALFHEGEPRLYEAMASTQRESLVAYWNLDEGGGSRFDRHNGHTLTEGGGSLGATAGNFGKVAIVSIDQVTGGAIRVVWRGTPGFTYEIQTSSQLIPSSWNFLTTKTAGVDGLFEIVEATEPGSNRYYRAARP